MKDDSDLHKDLSTSIFEFIHRHHERFDRSESDDEPLPATHSEMIIMALVDMRRPASAEEINLWVTKLHGADCRAHRQSGSRECPAKRLLTIGSLLTSSFDLPVVDVPSEPMRWTTSIRDAVLFLCRRSFSPWSPDKSFPIMDLPAELRECIFTYALALPPGARMKTKEPRRNSRGERWEISAPRWHSSSKHYEVDPDFLALLRVSKAFYWEASPCFWSQDILVSGNAPKICRLLRGATASRYVKQIDLKLRDKGFQRSLEGNWAPFGDGDGDDDSAIALLATLPRLRKLVVRLTPLKAYGGKEVMLRIPSVVSLRRHVRGLEELVVYGPLKDCEDILRAELVGPGTMLGPS